MVSMNVNLTRHDFRPFLNDWSSEFLSNKSRSSSYASENITTLLEMEGPDDKECSYSLNDSCDYEYAFDSCHEQCSNRIYDRKGANRPYLNQSETEIRVTALGLLVATPTISLIINVVEAAFRALKLLTLAHFWQAKLDLRYLPFPDTDEKDSQTDINQRPLAVVDFLPNNPGSKEGIGFTIHRLYHEGVASLALHNRATPYSFHSRIKSVGCDLLFIALLIPTLFLRQLAALYTLVRPRDGAKLYASFERLQGANFFLAPCLQPYPTRHGLGGHIPENSLKSRTEGYCSYDDYS